MLALIALLIERPRPRPAAADPCLFAPQNKHDNKRASLSLSLSLSLHSRLRSFPPKVKYNYCVCSGHTAKQSGGEERRRGGPTGQLVSQLMPMSFERAVLRCHCARWRSYAHGSSGRKLSMTISTSIFFVVHRTHSLPSLLRDLRPQVPQKSPSPWRSRIPFERQKFRINN